jgi:3-oxoacyl-[acyl-carrier-protein] synthase II
LSNGRLNPDRTGVVLGAGTGDLLRNEEYFAEVRARGVARATPSRIFNFFSNTPVDVVGTRFGLTGPRHCVVAACASSTIAIGYAADAIRSGAMDTALAGGADALCRLTFSGFNALRLVDTEPCRPFDAGRQGMTIGEAGAVLVLEDLDRARARGATIYAELAGYGSACEAYHPTSPEPDGTVMAATIRAALADASLPADAVGHINAHATGTLHNDRAEARAFHRVFGDRAASLPVNAIKSMVGHCLGAAGAIEAAVLALTIARGVIPPTIHHQRLDPECPLDVVPNEAREIRVRCGVSTSLAFGGNNAALVMQEVE